jgi:hypothetical protein
MALDAMTARRKPRRSGWYTARSASSDTTNAAADASARRGPAMAALAMPAAPIAAARPAVSWTQSLARRQNPAA